MDENKKTLAQEWFESATSDFEYAKIGLQGIAIFPQVAFLSEQVAEKFLKGFLILNGVELPYIHDLPKLLDECVKLRSELENLRDACELLTGFYVESRYPPDIPEYTKEEIQQAFEKARLVKEAIEKTAT